MNNISFIIPAFNCEKTVKESVESILNGNFEGGDEIIIVNDGSTDNTKIVIEDIQKSNADKIKIINHDKNKGGGAARNTAVKNTKNDLIFCLDSDNILMPNSIKPLKELLLKNPLNTAAAFQKVKYFTKNIKKCTHEWIFTRMIIQLQDTLCGHNNPPSSGNYLYTKESWKTAGGYPEDVGALDAWGFGIRQLATGGSITILPNQEYYHRFGHQSYWARENNDLSVKARKILEPFFDKIYKDDIEYINTSQDWFEKINKKPIRTSSLVKGTDGKVIIFKKLNSLYLFNIFNRLRILVRRISIFS